MADEEDSQALQSSLDFTQASALDILVPDASSLDIEKALSSAEAERIVENSSLVPAVAQRHVLFFDEIISVYVVLRTLYHDEPQLKLDISRLAVSLEVHAINSPPNAPNRHHAHQTNGGGQVKDQNRDILWSGSINTTDDPIVVVRGSDNVEERPQVYVFWKLTALLSRPRIRMQDPVILFKPSATIQSAQTSKAVKIGDQYLPSCVPTSLNLLESLQDDPALRGIEPRLSALRVSQVPYITQNSKSQTRPLTRIAQRSFPAMPALSARIRYTRSNVNPSKPMVIASLDIETAPFLESEISLEKVQTRMTEGSAEDLVTGHTIKLPMRCQPRDAAVFLYRLIPFDSFADRPIATSNARTLDIVISATVLISANSRPHIEMRWKTAVDFSTALNSSYGAPGQSLQRSNRPASLPVPSSFDGRLVASAPAELPNTAESTPNEHRSTPITDLGITVTFTGPKEVYVGKPFRWDVFVVNRSSHPRKLALMVISKRRRGDARNKHLSKGSSSSASGSKDGTIAEAVVDENFLHAMQKNATMDTAQLVNLSTDMRIGPLNPGSCHSSELKFLPLAKGVLSVEAIRVIDTVSSMSIDVRDLPDIVATELPVAE